MENPMEMEILMFLLEEQFRSATTFSHSQLKITSSELHSGLCFLVDFFELILCYSLPHGSSTGDSTTDSHQERINILSAAPLMQLS